MSQQPPQPRMCVFKVKNYCHCRGCNERIQEFYNHIAKKFGLPKQKINEDELKDGIVKVRGTASESEVWKILKEYTKKKKVFLVKDQNGSSNTSTTTEAHQGNHSNQLKNLPVDISNKGGKNDNESEKNGDKGQPKSNHYDQQQEQQRDANSRRKGYRGFTSGSIYEISESSQMGERRGGEPSQQTPQTSRYPMGRIEAQNDRMDNMVQYPMNYHLINRGESQWECYFSEDNANSCTIM